MLARELGNSGIKASVVAFGAWAIGGWKWGGTDARASVAAIQASLDAGVNLIDTAAVYGFGLSEELVGEAIKGRNRDKIIIATKCGLRWDLETPTLHAVSDGYHIHRTLSADSIAFELEQSLQRLGTDYVDLYQTHWPDPQTAPEDVMNTLLDLKKAGKIRAIGLCNSDAKDLDTASRQGALDVDQERYSMLDRERDADNLPLCIEKNIAFLAYSPIAQGLLSGKIDAAREFPEGDLRHGNPRFEPAVRDAVQSLLAPMNDIAVDRNLTLEQVVLAWTLQQPGVSHVLVGTRNDAQARSNAAAGSVTLSSEELTAISNAASRWAGFASFS